MRYLPLALLAFSAQLFAFPLTSWVPSGSNQVNLCWSPVADATHYELYVGDSFIGDYAFANSVTDTGAVHFRPDLPGREYMYLAALNTNNEVIATSDTVGCYYLINVDVPPGIQKVIPFALGKLEYRNFVGDSGCFFTDEIATQPSNIIGVQVGDGVFPNADRISRQDGGHLAYSWLNSEWTGSLEFPGTMLLGRAYYFQTIQSSNSPILTGRARSDYQPAGIIHITGGPSTASTPVGFLLLDQHSVATMGLETEGFRNGTFTTGDKVVEQRSGRSAYITLNGQWHGSLDYCQPEIPYFIMNRPHDNGTWVYNVQSVGLP